MLIWAFNRIQKIIVCSYRFWAERCLSLLVSMYGYFIMFLRATAHQPRARNTLRWRIVIDYR